MKSKAKQSKMRAFKIVYQKSNRSLQAQAKVKIKKVISLTHLMMMRKDLKGLLKKKVSLTTKIPRAPQSLRSFSPKTTGAMSQSPVREKFKAASRKMSSYSLSRKRGAAQKSPLPLRRKG